MADPDAAPSRGKVQAAPKAVPPSRGRMLEVGEAAPWVSAMMLGGTQPSEISKLGGSHVLMLFLGFAGAPASSEALEWARASGELRGDDQMVIAVTIDPSDAASGRIARAPGLEFYLDHDHALSRAFGAAQFVPEGLRYHPHWLLLDPALRVIGRWSLGESAAATQALRHATAAFQPAPAPVLIVRNILEPAFCRMLIDLYEAHGGEVSGFMRQVDGKTVPIFDDRHKRRRDHYIDDETICQAFRWRVSNRLLPMIERSFQYKVTRIERYVVACYDAAEGGHFAAHRDNTTSATAHRRFAVSINLNDDYEGGDLTFPEFGPQTYRAPLGGAVVFSCSLKHAATRVTAGRRYATLPFLYDDAAAAIREANAATLAQGSNYRA